MSDRTPLDLNISSSKVTLGAIVRVAFEDFESIAEDDAELQAFRARAANWTFEDLQAIDNLIDELQDDIRNYFIDKVRATR